MARALLAVAALLAIGATSPAVAQESEPTPDHEAALRCATGDEQGCLAVIDLYYPMHSVGDVYLVTALALETCVNGVDDFCAALGLPPGISFVDGLARAAERSLDLTACETKAQLDACLTLGARGHRAPRDLVSRWPDWFDAEVAPLLAKCEAGDATACETGYRAWRLGGFVVRGPGDEPPKGEEEEDDDVPRPMMGPRGWLGVDGGLRGNTTVDTVGLAVGARGDFLIGPAGIGVRIEWTVDRTLQKREERTMGRYAHWLHGELALSFPKFDLLAGAGPGIGWVQDPNDVSQKLTSWGVHQFVEVLLHSPARPATLGVGLRLELHQLWQPDWNDEMEFGLGISLSVALGLRSAGR